METDIFFDGCAVACVLRPEMVYFLIYFTKVMCIIELVLDN